MRAYFCPNCKETFWVQEKHECPKCEWRPAGIRSSGKNYCAIGDDKYLEGRAPSPHIQNFNQMRGWKM